MAMTRGTVIVAGVIAIALWYYWPSPAKAKKKHAAKKKKKTLHVHVPTITVTGSATRAGSYARIKANAKDDPATRKWLHKMAKIEGLTVSQFEVALAEVPLRLAGRKFHGPDLKQGQLQAAGMGVGKGDDIGTQGQGLAEFYSGLGAFGSEYGAGEGATG
jgi:hypothetical protein